MICNSTLMESIREYKQQQEEARNAMMDIASPVEYADDSTKNNEQNDQVDVHLLSELNNIINVFTAAQHSASPLLPSYSTVLKHLYSARAQFYARVSGNLFNVYAYILCRSICK
jgi:hypothetical protein